MRVLAIDPGDSEGAYVLYDAATEVILDKGKLSNHELRALVARAGANPVITDFAIEMVACYGMAVGEDVFETCVWIGRLIEAWRRQHHLIYRMEVKMHLCKNSRAKDPNIRQALVDRFGPKGTKKNPGKTFGVTADVWSALAVAVTYADRKVGK